MALVHSKQCRFHSKSLWFEYAVSKQDKKDTVFKSTLNFTCIIL